MFYRLKFSTVIDTDRRSTLFQNMPFSVSRRRNNPGLLANEDEKANVKEYIPTCQHTDLNRILSVTFWILSTVRAARRLGCVSSSISLWMGESCCSRCTDRALRCGGRRYSGTVIFPVSELTPTAERAAHSPAHSRTWARISRAAMAYCKRRAI